MKQLDPDDYLDAYRATQAPRETTLNAVYARLQAELGPGSGPLGGGTASAIHGAVKILVGLTVAAGLGLILGGRETPSPNAESRTAASQERVDVEELTDLRRELPLETKPVAAQPPDFEREDSASTPASQPAPSAAQARSQSDRRQPDRSPALATGEATEPQASEASDLAADLGAIKRIRADVIAARFDEALVGIGQHRIVYPNSPLAKERTVLELEARCGRDGAAEAPAEARRFLDQNPASTMAERVRVACELSE